MKPSDRVDELETMIEKLIHYIHNDVWGSIETKEMLRDKLLWELYPALYGKEECLDALYYSLYDTD